MPSYQYRCRSCDTEIDMLFPIGVAPRQQACPRGTHTMELVIGKAVQIAPSALETKGAVTRATNEMEGRWNRDMPAYKRMRNRGMQPKGIDGCAALEDKVGDQLDINFHRLYEKGVTRERVIEGREQAQEIADTGVPL